MSFFCLCVCHDKQVGYTTDQKSFLLIEHQLFGNLLLVVYHLIGHLLLLLVAQVQGPGGVSHVTCVREK